MDRRMTFLSAGVAALSLATVVIAKKPEKPGGKPGGDSQHVIQVVIDGHGISSCTNINLGCVVEIGLRDRPTTRLWLHSDTENRLIAMALELGGVVLNREGRDEGHEDIQANGWYGSASLNEKKRARGTDSVGEFSYELDDHPCRATTYFDFNPQPDPEDWPDEVCRFSLFIFGGHYNRKTDTWTFNSDQAEYSGMADLALRDGWEWATEELPLLFTITPATAP